MGALLQLILRVGSYVLAGVGIGEVLDKVVKPKVPATYYPEPIGIGYRVPRILWIIGAFVLGVWLVRFLGKKLQIKILK